MPGTVKMRRGPFRKSKTSGWVSDFEDTNRTTAALVVNQLNQLRQTAGAPWRSERITRSEAVQRISEFDTVDQHTVDTLRKMSVKELLQAAFDAIKLRRTALKEGEWVPPPDHPAAAYAAQAQPAPQMNGQASGRRNRIKPVHLPVRETIGGVRVPPGVAAMARAVAPQNPSVSAPIVQSQLLHGDVVPRGA